MPASSWSQESFGRYCWYQRGLDPKTGKPIEYNPNLDVQTYVTEARALRGDPMKRTCPTWHDGAAYQPTAYNWIKHTVGTPLNGAPVTYTIGPKQYVAVPGSGRHLHPIKYDNLETSRYLFVFALD